MLKSLVAKFYPIFFNAIKPFVQIDPKGIGAALLAGSGGAFVLSIASLGVSFFTQLIVARSMGVINYGEYIYTTTWIALLSIPALLGFTSGSVKFVSQYCAMQEWSLLKGFLRFSIILPALACLLTAIAYFSLITFSDNSGIHRSASELSWLYGITLLLPSSVLMNIQAFTLKGLKKTTIAESRNLLYTVLMLLAILLFSELATENLSSEAVILISACITIFISISMAFVIRKYLPHQVQHCEARYNFKNWIKVLIPMLFISGISVLLKKSDIIMLGMLSGTDEAGIYSVATRISDLCLLGFIALTAIAAPMMSEYFSKNEFAKLQRLVKLVIRANIVITLISTVVIYIFADFVLDLFGPEYRQAKNTLTILLVAQIINSTVGPATQLLMMTGFQMSAALILVASVVTNLILNYTLIPAYGMNGAAIATSVSLVLATMLSMVKVNNSLKIRSFFV